MCSYSGRLIYWEFGSRNPETLMKLMKRLEPWNVLFYCADHYEAYKSFHLIGYFKEKLEPMGLRGIMVNKGIGF